MKTDDSEILKFIGARPVHAKDINCMRWTIDDPKNPFFIKLHGRITHVKLEFTTNWNWIIPLVGMIEPKVREILGVRDRSSDECDIVDISDDITNAVVNNDIDSAYKNCVSIVCILNKKR